jgi:hypothetical protein
MAGSLILVLESVREVAAGSCVRSTDYSMLGTDATA